MIAPRLEVDLGAIEHNARVLVARLGRRGIAVTGVTKATLGSPEVGRAMVRGGVTRLGDTRIENLEALREAGIKVPLVLLRSPTPDQAGRAVLAASASLVTEYSVVEALSAAAGKTAANHGIVLMIEMGDLSEGVLSNDVLDIARKISRTPHVTLMGLGTTLGSRSAVVPGDAQMSQISALATVLRGKLHQPISYVTGGTSASLRWALGKDPVGEISDVRLGEAILLGVDPLTRAPIEGLRTDAFALVGAVIESSVKPSAPWGLTRQAAFGATVRTPDRGEIVQTIVSLGRQDTDPDGLEPPVGVTVLATSSDQLILETATVLAPGTELRFGVDYSALMRAMTSPFVAERLIAGPAGRRCADSGAPRSFVT